MPGNVLFFSARIIAALIASAVSVSSAMAASGAAPHSEEILTDVAVPVAPDRSSGFAERRSAVAEKEKPRVAKSQRKYQSRKSKRGRGALSAKSRSSRKH